MQFIALNIAGRVCDTGAPCRVAVSGCRGVGLIRCRQLLANDRNPRPESLLTARRERFMSSIFEHCTWIYMLQRNPVLVSSGVVSDDNLKLTSEIASYQHLRLTVFKDRALSK